MRFASNTCLPFERFCGWIHALRSTGSSTNFRRMVFNLSISARPVLTEDLVHHSLLPSQLVDINAFGILLNTVRSAVWLSLLFLFPRVPGTFLSVACLGTASGSAFPAPGALFPTPRVMGAVVPAAPPDDVSSIPLFLLLLLRLLGAVLPALGPVAQRHSLLRLRPHR